MIPKINIKIDVTTEEEYVNNILSRFIESKETNSTIKVLNSTLKLTKENDGIKLEMFDDLGNLKHFQFISNNTVEVIITIRRELHPYHDQSDNFFR